jgi:hypothetical protein
VGAQPLSDFQGALAKIARVGWEIINDPMAKNQDRMMAMREVREAYNTSLTRCLVSPLTKRRFPRR